MELEISRLRSPIRGQCKGGRLRNEREAPGPLGTQSMLRQEASARCRTTTISCLASPGAL